MKTRNFIQETIDRLRDSADEIEKIWKQFQEGEIDKENFESGYHHIVADWVIDTLEEEQYTPNNGCKYKDTNPDCKYFNDVNV